MKIRTFTKRIIPKDMRCAYSRINTAVAKGRAAGRNPQLGRYSNAKSQAKAVVKELKTLEFKKEEMPAVAAAITALIPIPSPIPITPIVYGIGKAITFTLKLTGKL